MSEVSDGGPAFPTEQTKYMFTGDDVGKMEMVEGTKVLSGGMSLRDYFAAHCPVTYSEFLHGCSGAQTATAKESLDAYSRLRLEYADSMLKARQS
jgi:hypothetical protein